MTHYRKLVRDKIPEILDAKGVAYTKTIADAQTYKAELVRKLTEEAEEFAEAGAPEELADVLEVIEALKQLPEYANVETLRRQKAAMRGAFEKRIILEGEK